MCTNTRSSTCPLLTLTAPPKNAYTLCCLQNLYDCIDLCDNALVVLDNFPPLRRLRCLLLAGNRVSSVGPGFAPCLPFLETLLLSNNRLSTLGDLEGLCPLPYLTTLFLLGNPVTRREHYRLFVLTRFKALRVLDGQRVTRKERVAAIRWAASKVGKAVLQEAGAGRLGGGGGGGGGGGEGGEPPAGAGSGAAAAAAARAPFQAFSSAAAGLRGASGRAGSGGSGSSSSAGAGMVGGGSAGGGTGGGGGAGAGAISQEAMQRLQLAIASAKTAAEIDMLEASLKNGTVLETLDRLERGGGEGGGGGGGGGEEDDMEQ